MLARDQIEAISSNSIDAIAPATENIIENITKTIGNTPLIRLSNLAKKYALNCELLAKVEYFNPAGSIKDRPAMAMIDALMASENFTDQTEIIEATSGNNGVACAWICAIRNIPLTIVIPEHMSIERRKLIMHYGATVVTTPKHLGTKGAIDQAERMVAEREHAVALNQFGNYANPQMHYSSTAEEIWRDTGGNVDIIVAGIGTGGTISGIGQALKKKNPNIQIIGVEPASCPVLTEGRSGTHKIQGLSSGHIPAILDQTVLDEVIAVSDEDAINYARMLARVEGLPVGISSGAAAFASIETARKPEFSGKRIVTIFADTAERYFSTELFEE